MQTKVTGRFTNLEALASAIRVAIATRTAADEALRASRRAIRDNALAVTAASAALDAASADRALVAVATNANALAAVVAVRAARTAVSVTDKAIILAR